jgi:ppGpp synthetase/RelA/SpoT-type nucleotidyltranferase
LDLIDGFIARYVKEYDYYEQAARMARQTLESKLQAAGIRAIVTSRAKSVTRLADKCRQRNKSQNYESIDEIYADIADLAGVRVALYFPAERDQVGGLINRLFHVDESRAFPKPSETRTDKRFLGYSALHYRVRLPSNALGESDQRYAAAKIEIQVASVLMHAWSEVEHDLVYKPAEGELSPDEHSLLDQLNGLVLTGEIALEQLQKAGETRVASGGRQFANHYELAAHVLSQVSAVNQEPVTDSGLGRIDLLFNLLSRLKLDTPDGLGPYLELLHGDLERRPVSEQIIDAVIAEDESAYQTYLSVRAEDDSSRGESSRYGSRDEPGPVEVGRFLMRWTELERLLREQVPPAGRWRVTPATSTLERLGVFNPQMSVEFDRLRQLRNDVVHGLELPSARDLAQATQRLATLISEIEHRQSS